MRLRLTLLAVLGVSLAGQPPTKTLLQKVKEAAAGVSAERISAGLKTLESFETRDTNGVIDAPGKGIRASREWIAEQFRQASPRLQVRFDTHRVPKGSRLVRDTDVVNVVAVLPGESDPDTHIIVGAHYDSMHMKTRAGSRTLDPDATASASSAPGVSDNASGVMCVLELAREMARHQWPKTLVFIAFAGEEQGLFGAKGYADKSAESKTRIEAVFNVDTIGTNVTGNGIPAGNRLNVYSDEPLDGPSRTLARYVREMAERYLPELTMNTVFRADRFGRGGDHTAFHVRGFAAVRFTTPTEQLENQHNERDTFDRVSVPYITLATRGIAAAFGALASAPSLPMLQPLGRGESRYDAQLRWRAPAHGPSPSAYSVFVRSTTAPFWEREVYAGAVTEFTLKNVSIDEWTFGVRAIGADGGESLIVPWTLPPSRFVSPPKPASTSPSSAN